MTRASCEFTGVSSGTADAGTFHHLTTTPDTALRYGRRHVRRTALIAALLAGSSTYAQVIAGGSASAQPQAPALPFVDRVSTLFDGERARATVAFLDQSVL